MRTFLVTIGEFQSYIACNDASLINYGERYLSGEGISSAFVEATVNAVISKRFAKKQQMQWSKIGAHLLLQTRTQTLDGSLRSTFRKWYPNMANDNTTKQHSPSDCPTTPHAPLFRRIVEQPTAQHVATALRSGSRSGRRFVTHPISYDCQGRICNAPA